MPDLGKALDLHLAHVPWPRIAEQAKYRTAAAAQKAVNSELDKRSRKLHQLRTRQEAIEQLEALHRAVWPAAIRGDGAAVDRAARLVEQRVRLVTSPDELDEPLLAAFNTAVEALAVDQRDTTAVAIGRRLAHQVDSVVARGTPIEVTKALYLVPHLVSVLRELGATPAARDFVVKAAPSSGDAPVEGGDDLEEFRRKKGQAI